MSRLRLSLAIATCGRPDALRTCLAAIRRQSFAPAQLIIVDQDPLAETRDVIAQAKMPITYLEQERHGLSASRNLALSIAEGDVLAVTDDDCFPDARWVEELLYGFDSRSAPDAVTGPILPPPGDPPGNMCALSLRPSTVTRLFSTRVIPWQVGSGANFAARVALLREMGGWDERLGVGTRGMAAEDIDILDRLLAAECSILYSGRAVIHHAWQTRDRRRETRWSYGYGIGAMSGLRLGRHDAYGWRLLASYTRMHLRGLLRDARRGEWAGVGERMTSLSALVPSLGYGLKAARVRVGKVTEHG